MLSVNNTSLFFKYSAWLICITVFFSNCSTTSISRATTIESALQNDSKISTFNTLVETLGGIDQILNDPSQKHTLFVPNNEAFDILGQKLLDNLSLPSNHDVLKGILQSHICQGTYTASTIEKSTEALKSIFDTTISLPDNSAKILYTIKTRQGLVHVVDKVIQR